VVGDIFLDINIRTDKFQLIEGGVFHSKEANYSFGGSGNISAALSLLGIDNYFVGKAGRDLFGNLYRIDLEKNRVKTDIFLDDKSPTGIVVSIIDEHAERSFVIARGANDNFKAEEVDKVMDEIDCRFLYITGYSLVNSPQRDAILHAAKRAYNAGIKIFFDIGAYNVIEKSQRYFDDIIKITNVLSTNAKEAKTLLHASDTSQALKILSETVPIAVIRLGKDGCLISAHGRESRVPAPVIESVDTTGAGDAFNAALMYGMLNRMSYDKIASFANWFASRKVQHIGARSFPLRAEINSILNSIRGN
jgi:sugar/nucleoside kinase (ribokinase family)